MIKKIYGNFLRLMTMTIGIDAAKKFDTYFRYHKKLDLKKPTTLSDKVTYIELHDQSPISTTCTDKYDVREYVSEKGYADALVPLVGGGLE